MCRGIKPLFNFAPPVTDDEIHAASLQFVREISSLDTDTASVCPPSPSPFSPASAVSSAVSASLANSSPIHVPGAAV